MEPAVILQYVRDADPAFVQIMSKAPDPAPSIRDQVLTRLPELHRLFLEKRRAAQAFDEQAWNKIIDQQGALIAAYDAF